MEAQVLKRIAVISVAIALAAIWLIQRNEGSQPSSHIASKQAGQTNDALRLPRREPGGAVVPGRQSVSPPSSPLSDQSKLVATAPPPSPLAGVALPVSSSDLMALYFKEGSNRPDGNPSRLQDLHNAFAHEPVDPSWGPAAQAQIKFYTDDVSQRSGGWLDFTSVECHSTVCEIQVVGTFRDVHNGDPMDWQAYAAHMGGEAWFRDRYDSPINAVTRAPDGRWIYVSYFYRKPQSPKGRASEGSVAKKRFGSGEVT
jgi:hypothetical protein